MNGSHKHLRKFDHDEARRLYADGVPKREIARRFGVSPKAVRLAVDEELRLRDQARRLEWIRVNKREPCLNECGRLVWTHNANSSGLCVACAWAARRTT